MKHLLASLVAGVLVATGVIATVFALLQDKPVAKIAAQPAKQPQAAPPKQEFLPPEPAPDPKGAPAQLKAEPLNLERLERSGST
jgi:hypothetical protein